jgi:AcrR family transcriptional regulator
MGNLQEEVMAATDITLPHLMAVAAITYDRPMGRWQPNAQGRLAQAAMELFVERGFEQTTVAEIAARAGLTERTFFRHYTDKREVLFAGGEVLRQDFVSAVAAAPESATAMQAMTLGLDAAAAMLEGERGREFARRRQQIIGENSELRERELIKLAGIATALAETLRERGVEEPGASLTAELGISVFRIAFERWITDGNERSFSELIEEALSGLVEVVTR